MAGILRAARGALYASSLRHLIPASRQWASILPRPRSMGHIAEMRKSAFRENLLRILRTEIDYQIEVRAPKTPAKKFNFFTVEEHPGEQYIRLRRSYGEEEIKVDVTMFDGYSRTSANEKANDPGGDMKLHMSLIVHVLKHQDHHGILQFICSAWPDALMAEKVFVYKSDPAPLRPFMGPNFQELDEEVQEAIMKYLHERGIDDEMAAFLHEYIANKDVCEHLRWMSKIKAYVEG